MCGIVGAIELSGKPAVSMGAGTRSTPNWPCGLDQTETIVTITNRLGVVDFNFVLTQTLLYRSFSITPRPGRLSDAVV